MGRLLVVWDRGVQVVCYPWAHWSNAYEIIRNKTATSDRVTKVILSFGINDKNHASTESLGKMIKKTKGSRQHLSKHTHLCSANQF